MTIAILSIIEALKTPGGHIVIVGPTDRQAGELFSKITNFIKNAPIGSEVQTATQRQMIMKNGCRISSFPCGDTGDNIRGMTANVLIMEESAFIKDNIVNQVLLPMVAATNGKIIKISTPFGMNHFYVSFQKDDNYISHHYTWEDAVDVGHFTQEFIDEQRLQCSSLEFQTEYEAAFIPDQDAYFPYALVEHCIKDYTLLEESNSVIDASKSYLLGIDFARMGQDSTVYVVIEKGEPNKVVFIKEVPQNTMDEAIDYVKFLHQKFRFKKIICDQTGLGAGPVDVLSKELNTPKRKINETSYNTNYISQDIVIGVTFTMRSKEDIFSNLKIVMEQGQLVFPNIKKLIFELKDFRYETTPTGNLKLHHSENGHDDFVDALACAAHGLRGRQAAYFFG
jgi:phage terminase large subunit-like protein|tara:strand:+ start:12154 stop:13338 length:1185 start_codon:yes stop_codon:yes gene_type:complete